MLNHTTLHRIHTITRDNHSSNSQMTIKFCAAVIIFSGPRQNYLSRSCAFFYKKHTQPQNSAIALLTFRRQKSLGAPVNVIHDRKLEYKGRIFWDMALFNLANHNWKTEGRNIECSYQNQWRSVWNVGTFQWQLQATTAHKSTLNLPSLRRSVIRNYICYVR
jgi:hypothetical protein